jgi:signal transduction histidine kinase
VWMWFVTRDGCGFSRRMHDSGAVLPVAGIPPSKEPNDIGEDADGNVWVTFRDGGLARWRHGAIRMFGRADGLPDAWTASVYVDHRRRLWISSAAGTALLNVEDQSGDHPRFVWFSPADGLPSPRSAGYFTEDRWGNLYAGTGYGVDRIDADRMHGVRFGAADGMIDVQAWSVLADSSGWLWAATSKGIARFFPEKVEPPRPSVVRIHAFRIAGTRYPLSFVGETNVSDVSIPLGYSPIEFEYATVAGNVQYQYRLDAGSRDWRSVRNASITLASLPAGSYHFAVRAVGRDGVVLGPPATVAFTIVPPFWQRWWFQTLAVAAILAAGLGAYRYRVARLLELERIRTRIATELHDDIGSSLSQIAILSEVASRRVGTTAPDVTPALQSIQRTASEMVDSMSDIVWAINPRQDALADLAGRMRRFGSDLLGGRDITFEFDTSNLDAGIHVSPELRREVFLTFKEGLRNIVRHSRCTRVAATLRAGGGSLELTLVDNGIGFDPDSPATGLGLANLRSRAAALGGVLDIRSAAGHGTSIHLRLPLRRSTGPFPYWRRP